ncbi:MAG: histidine phosphatase family protein [Alphaproteobacteria bacterium]|nr:histidine phosphatase family protein [Alphaproteobacteria bacterium]
MTGDPVTGASAALFCLRHGPTAWTAKKRLQGRADIPLSPEGRRTVATWRVPIEFQNARWISSPLSRATETAEIMRKARSDPPPMETDPRLIELDFGGWEGRTIAELAAEHGESFRTNEARGLDMRPEGGETPRELQDRLRPFLADCGRRGAPAVIIAHKGVLRALLALATGWDMKQDPPERLRDGVGHLFTAFANGAAALETLNIALTFGGDEDKRR